ncbi:MAG: family 10 glycosylhydrolase [Candidatus Latescibacterota bacterium]
MNERLSMSEVELSQEHTEAVERPRRIINQYDPLVGCLQADRFLLERYVEAMLGFADWQDHQIDSVWWDIGEGNMSFYPSKVLVPWPNLREWLEAGNDLLRPFVVQTRARGLEVLFSYRMNAGDSGTAFGLSGMLPMKQAHPDWLINWNPDPNGEPQYRSPWDKNTSLWNFAVPEVRQYKLDILRELAENYDFDGIQLDFARCCPVLPIDHQWEHRESLTDFMRSVRRMLLEVAEKRGRPFLLAAKVPENLEGCHFDGMDIETWTRERLVDIFALGCRSLDVDIPSFRNLTSGAPIKLYPCHDCHHASDAYKYPPLEVLRGVCSNWWRQGADGIQIFNYLCTTKEAWTNAGGLSTASMLLQDCQGNQEAYREIGSPETLRRKNKTFVVQRRAGGHPWLFGWPEEGKTQSWMYHNSNMLSPLPARLDRHGHCQTLLRLYVGDDVNAGAERGASLRLGVLLSDAGSKDLPPEQRIAPAVVRLPVYGGDGQETIPLPKEILPHVEVRLNNVPLGAPEVDAGWLEFVVQPRQIAPGSNLVGVHVKNMSADRTDDLQIERVELHVRYRDVQVQIQR